MTFNDLKIDDRLVNALSTEGIKEPTSVQQTAIPAVLEKKNLIIQSPTGTGKTLAYLLPLFELLKENNTAGSVLILAPTHELVIQIQRQIERLSTNSGVNIKSAALIGNVNIKRQIDKLKEKPQIITGSAGRILELIRLKKIRPRDIKTIVLDEADRLLDMNNKKATKDLIKECDINRQILLFSASISENTVSQVKEYSDNFIVLRDNEVNAIPDTIRHSFCIIPQQDKITTLRKMLGKMSSYKALVFLNKNDQIENLITKLCYHDFKAGALHGSFRKLERKKVMDDFRGGRINILIASDIAARGLHVDGVTHVFNMDIPEDPREYLHRAGRTGRNNSEGFSISLLTEYEYPYLKQASDKFNFKLSEF